MEIPKRFTKKKFVEALHDPSMFYDELHRWMDWDVLVHKIVARRCYNLRHGGGVDVMERDWDTLILLDACRYDIFEEINDIPGELTSVLSQGSHSEEFIENNFSGKQFHNTVYVTANVYGAQVEGGVFHDVVVSFADDADNPRHKDNRSPELVRDLAIKAHEQYPNKRLIIHFMQPHSPYFSDTAETVRQLFREQDGIQFRTWDGQPDDDSEVDLIKDLNEAAMQGDISPQLLRNLYKENLEIVLDATRELLEELDGKTVVSSDHGELLGEREAFFRPLRYNHPKHVYMKELRRVPWLIIDAAERRNVVSEPPEKKQALSEDTIEDQLEALGYV